MDDPSGFPSTLPWKNPLPYLSLKPVDESRRVLELCDKKKEEKSKQINN